MAVHDAVNAYFSIVGSWGAAAELNRHPSYDGEFVSIQLDPAARAGVLIEIHDNQLLLHLWDGEMADMSYGEKPVTLVITHDYNAWRQCMELKTDGC